MLAVVKVDGREVQITEQRFILMYVLKFIGEEQKYRESISIIEAEERRWQQRAKECDSLERVVLGDGDTEPIDSPPTFEELGVCACDDVGCGICRPSKEPSPKELIEDLIEEAKVRA